MLAHHVSSLAGGPRFSGILDEILTSRGQDTLLRSATGRRDVAVTGAARAEDWREVFRETRHAAAPAAGRCGSRCPADPRFDGMAVVGRSPADARPHDPIGRKPR